MEFFWSASCERMLALWFEFAAFLLVLQISGAWLRFKGGFWAVQKASFAWCLFALWIRKLNKTMSTDICQFISAAQCSDPLRNTGISEYQSFSVLSPKERQWVTFTCSRIVPKIESAMNSSCWLSSSPGHEVPRMLSQQWSAIPGPLASSPCILLKETVEMAWQYKLESNSYELTEAHTTHRVN